MIARAALHRISPAILMVSAMVAGACDDRMAHLRERVEPRFSTGAPVPDIAAPALEGDTVHIEALRGEVVLLNVWAMWCKPCVEELPMLEQLHQRFGSRGMRLIGISVDHDGPQEILAFLENHRITYTNLRARQHDLEREFGWGRGIPQSLLIDRQGRIALHWRGGISPTDTAAVRFLSDTIAALVGG